MLRLMRHEWNMEFACGGAEALAILGIHHFDVVVSDMRMPGMSGAQLLTEIRHRHPHIVRIILSGYADEELTLKSLGPAHQFLSKPCRAEAIKSTVSRACALRDLLGNEKLQLLVSQMQSLPSLPTLYIKLTEELAAAESSLKKVGDIISQDLGMTAKVLQMVNSAFFGVRRHISSPTEAVGLLGLDTIMTLVLTIQIFSQFEDECLANFSPAALWAHSLQVGLFAKRLSQAAGQGGEVVKDAFTAGLLHDAGQLVLAANLPRQFAESLELAQAEKLSHHEAERQVFGATHSEVGAYLFGLWGLPQSIVEAVAYHHRPADCVAEGFGPLTAVHVGNALERETQALPPEWCFAALDMDYLAKLGLADRLPEWRDLYIRVAKDQSA
jgi:HD-like signal output (HDOD) protein